MRWILVLLLLLWPASTQRDDPFGGKASPGDGSAWQNPGIYLWQDKGPARAQPPKDGGL